MIERMSDAVEAPVEPGLCGTCSQAHIVRADRGAIYLKCLLSEKNAAFQRYPRLPVLSCSGFERQMSKR